MKKSLFFLVLVAFSGLLLAQGGITGTAQATLNIPAAAMYGQVVAFTVNVNLSGVTGNEAVGLGGFTVPIGFNSNFKFYDATSGSLPGSSTGNPPTMVFVYTDPTIAASNGWFGVVGATSADSAATSYLLATCYGRPMAMGQMAFDVNPSGLPSQNQLSLSSKWTASNGGPETITTTAVDNSLNVRGILVYANGDYDGDHTSDIAIYRPTTSTWFLLRSTSGYIARSFGSELGTPVPGDYDGDSITDLAYYEPTTGRWHVTLSGGGTMNVAFGNPTSIPVPGDYDGDGHTDIAIYQPSSGRWFVLGSTAGYSNTQFGNPDSIPVPGDYDNDGITDKAIYQPSNGRWYILRSTAGYQSVQFGNLTSTPVPGDYDGDGRMDIAIYQASNGRWYILGSTAGYSNTRFGNPTSVPTPGDYDGDGRADISIFEPGNGRWFLLRSTAGYTTVQFGGPTDVPVSK